MSKCICDSLDLFKGGCTCGFTEATEEAAKEALASPDEGEGEDEDLIFTCDCGCGATYNPSIEAAKCNLQDDNALPFLQIRPPLFAAEDLDIGHYCVFIGNLARKAQTFTQFSEDIYSVGRPITAGEAIEIYGNMIVPLEMEFKLGQPHPTNCFCNYCQAPLGTQWAWKRIFNKEEK